MTPIEEQFYSQAAEEIAQRTVMPGLMAKALVDAEGDAKRAAALYIKARVERLAEEHAAALVAEAAYRKRLEGLIQRDKQEKKWIYWSSCPACKFEGRMNHSSWREFLMDPRIECPKCGTRFEWHYVPSPDLEKRAREQK